MRDTAFKQTLAELEVGDEVGGRGAEGLLPAARRNELPYVFVAGGIGITVFPIMLRYIADEGFRTTSPRLFEPRPRVDPFLDELGELESRIEGLRLVLTMTEDPSWDGESRRIDEAMFCATHLGDLDAYTFWSPARPRWRRRSGGSLQEAGVPEDQFG